MLPQKFSAATTRTVPEPGSPFATAPQPAAPSAATIPSSDDDPPHTPTLQQGEIESHYCYVVVEALALVFDGSDGVE